MGNCAYSPVKIEGEVEKKENGVATVKIVLTKGELDWLMMEMKKTKGGREGVKDLLQEIESQRMVRRGKNQDQEFSKFKPDLETISEDLHH